MRNHLKECGVGLFWSVVILATVFVHYAVCVDVPEFRYIGF